MPTISALPTAEFFETYPLYKKLVAKDWTQLSSDSESLPRPPLNMLCATCKARQTFVMANQYSDEVARIPVTRGGGSSSTYVCGSVIRAIYACAACGALRTFLLEFGPQRTDRAGGPGTLYSAWVRKVGQTPEWTVAIEPEVRASLGSHLEYFERGVACEGIGYGIGALAYYRRVLEEVVHQLSATKEAALSGAERNDFSDALKKARSEHSLAREIELIKDVIPQAGRAGQINPLAALYSLCSEGMHLGGKETGVEDDPAGGVDTVRVALTGLLVSLETRRREKLATKSMFDALRQK